MNILVVDVETNSVNPQRADILEVGMAMVELATGATELLVDTLINPDCPESEWLHCWFMEHSGINPDEIRQAPKFAAVKEEIQQHLLEYPVTAFNRSYDHQVLYRHGVKLPKLWPCLMLTCKDILKLPGFHGDFKYPKFSEAWNWFFPGEYFNEKHRAGHDVMHEARLAVALYQGEYFDNALRCDSSEGVRRGP